MRRLFLFLLFCIAIQYAKAQTCPANLDFENGDLSYWQCSVGYVDTNEYGKNVIHLHDTLPTKDRHEIITAEADGTIPLDPYGKFPAVCPFGGKYSVRLGNDSAGAQAEGMSYTFTVPSTADTFSFTYFYAVVFQDPGHVYQDQPRFFVTAYEVATGNIINCASYDYVSTSGLPGFSKTYVSSDPVLYKEWSPSSIQFVNLGGKQVRLEFKTADCTETGHFGYAYFDVGSGCSNILATAPYCKETNSLLLNAPFGFQYYTWYNEDFSQVIGHSQNLTLTPPPVTAGRFYVDINPYPGYGCRDTVYADVFPLPVPEMPDAQTEYGYCQNDYTSALTATPAINCTLQWYTDTTQAPLAKPPFPSSRAPGTYYFYVSQKILFGCESFRKRIAVKIYPVPVVSFSLGQFSQCLNGNRFEFTSTSQSLEDPIFIWLYGDGITDTTTAVTSHSYKDSGDYRVTLRVENGPGCSRNATNTIRLVPKPVAVFTLPAIICQNQTSFAPTDGSWVPKNLSSVADWHWQMKDQLLTGQRPAPVIPDAGGDFPVSLVVATSEGCLSDTARQVTKVHYQPQASFSHDALLCSNKIIHFTDKSFLPAEAAGESVTGWSWQFNTQAAAIQNPVMLLSAADYDIGLTVETNFGCNSLTADSLVTVNPKPVIGIAINDSCVSRNIRYTAQDVAQTVSTWFWDFGRGMKTGASVQSKVFYTAGDNTFTLYGKTAHGCIDTLYRPFASYDNKAFAGRDTLAAYDQPVQLNAHGGPDNHYTWTPSLGLNSDTLENPLATSRTDLIYQLDAITNEGCDAHSRVVIKRWNGPDIFIPTAFTPNGDNLNDLLHAKPVGMRQLDYFTVYDRNGKRVFYTNDFSQGWNGRVDGEEPKAGTYVAYAKAVDYTGREIMKKVYVVLIR